MIHLNIGSNLESEFGDRFENISVAVNFLINSKLKIKKISNFFETPSYPEWIHPIIKKNVKLLINNLDQKSRIEITRLNKNVIIKS